MYEHWESVLFSSVPLEAEKTHYAFFEDPEGVSDLDFRLDERAVIEFIAYNFRSQLVKLVYGREVDHVICELMVSDPYTAIDKLPGDVDIVLIDSSSPMDVAAIEVKVLRKRPDDADALFVSGFQKLAKGVEQANGLVHLGFSRVYLAVIVLANTSAQKENGIHARQIDDGIWARVRSHALGLIGGAKIGLINIEINMNTVKPFFASGQISGMALKSSVADQGARISEIASQKIRNKMTKHVV